MKPPIFAYRDPRELTEALALLAEHGTDAKVLAGGQSLMPLLNLRLARPAMLIDIGRIPGLVGIHSNGSLRIGAMTTHRTVEHDPRVRDGWPLLHAAISWVGHPPIRNRGTLGGSIAHADPAAEIPTALLALDGEVEVASTAGRRTVAARDLMLGYFMTTLAPDELITEIRIPRPPAGQGWSFQEVARRHGDFALVAVAATLQVDAEGRCRNARLVVAGANPAPTRITDVEMALEGNLADPRLFRAAAAMVSEAVEPESDLHASADYRRKVAAELCYRSLMESWQRCAL